MKKLKKNEETQVPTQEAAEAAKEKEKRGKQLKKDAMKRQRKGKLDTSACETNDSGKKASISKTKNSSKSTTGQKTKKVVKKAPAPQGRCKVSTAGDDSGCQCRGLRELDVRDRVWMAARMKVGARLHEKRCVDCLSKCEDLSDMRQPRTACTCNCGLTGHKVEEGEEGKEDCQCNMMLCLPRCNDRGSKMEAGPGNKRKRKNRRRSAQREIEQRATQSQARVATTEIKKRKQLAAN